MTAATVPSQDRQTADAVEFLMALFEPGDLVLFRFVESWIDSDGKAQTRVVNAETQYVRLGARIPGGGWQFVRPQLETLIQRLNATAERERANVFFGVCPRFGGGGEFDRDWQIRTVRCLWADLDGISPESAVSKCDAAELPPASIVVRSGNGVHLYWMLDNPVLLDDYDGDPLPLRTEYTEPDAKTGKRRARHYFIEPGVNGRHETRSYLSPATRPELSEKASEVQDTLSGIAQKIGGDHTHDMTRLLRLPGTMNRKNERNGERPKPCVVWRM